jgi:uncharacterized protein
MRTLHRFLAGLLLLIAASGWAQPRTDCPPPITPAGLKPEELQRDVRDRGLLWRIEKDGRASWLYGTVHAARVEWAVPGPRIRAALAGSEVVALELDPSDPELPRLFAQRPDPARDERVLAPLRSRIAALADRACVPGEHIASLRPMLQLVTLSMFEVGREGFHPELAIDMVLFGMARGLGKEIVALESAAVQVAALQPESEEDERVLLDRGLKAMETGPRRELVQRLLRAWANGDEATLASYPQWCMCLETPAERRFMHRLLDARNGGMADRLAALHASGRPVFAAVGALHMTGPRALQALLRERGFEVRLVPLSP